MRKHGFLKEHTYFQVQFDQTAGHVHHLKDLSLEEPQDFDWVEYLARDGRGKAAYAKENMSKDSIIEYQNELAKEIDLSLVNDDEELEFHEGTQKRAQEPCGIIIRKYTSNFSTISIIDKCIRCIWVNSPTLELYIINEKIF